MRAAALSADDLLTLGQLLPRAALDLLQLVGQSDALALLNALPGVVIDVPKSVHKQGQRQRGGGGGGVGAWQAVAQAVSAAALQAIVWHYGGTPMEIPICHQLRVERRNRWVRQRFDALTAPPAGHSRAEAVALLAGQARGELGEVLSAAGIGRVLDTPAPAAAVVRRPPLAQGELFA